MRFAFWRTTAVLGLAWAGVVTAHVTAYTLLFRCWSCRHDLGTPRHALFAVVTGGVIVAAGVLTVLCGRRTVACARVRVTPLSLLMVQIPVFFVVHLAQYNPSTLLTLDGGALVLGLALQLATAVVFSRLAGAVASIALALRSPAKATGHASVPRHVAPRLDIEWTAPEPVLLGGYLRAPPLLIHSP